MIRPLAILLCLLALVPAAPAPAGETPQEARRELRQRLTGLLARQKRTARALEAARREMAHIQGSLNREREKALRLREREEDISRRLARAGRQARELARRVRRDKAGFQARLRALYLFGPDASQLLLAGARDFQDALFRSQSLCRILAADQRRLEEADLRRSKLATLQAGLLHRRSRLREVRARLAKLERRQAALALRQEELTRELEARRRRLRADIKRLREAEARLARTFALGDLQPAGLGAGGVLAARGWLSPPVEGRVLGRSGPGRRGVVLAARAGSPVRSPWSGTVVYAGVLSGYGKVAVLDHGQRVHTVLAQLGALSVEAGDRLRAGQVVGAVGRTGSLYLEVRRGSRPENPLAWLRLKP
jgi:septal ring factor EnvC (AmiA/AmiB activator)